MKLSNLIALLTNRSVAGNAYVKDGELYQGNTAQAILVKDEDELDEVKKHVAPGSIAYTAGCASMWQLSAAGSWEAIQEEGGSGGGGGGAMLLTVTKTTVGITSTYTLNKTLNEIKDALAEGTHVVLYGESAMGSYIRQFTVVSAWQGEGEYGIENTNVISGDSYEYAILGVDADKAFVAGSADGYPAVVTTDK